jgi:hypothetical protein
MKPLLINDAVESVLGLLGLALCGTFVWGLLIIF